MKRSWVPGVLVLIGIWGAAWSAAEARADRELLAARNEALREEVAANARHAARRAALERQKAALDANEPAYAQILPVDGVASEERLLRDFQGMVDETGVRIVSVSFGRGR